MANKKTKPQTNSAHDYIQAVVARDMDKFYKIFGVKPPKGHAKRVKMAGTAQGGGNTDTSLMGPSDGMGRSWDSLHRRM